MKLIKAVSWVDSYSTDETKYYEKMDAIGIIGVDLLIAEKLQLGFRYGRGFLDVVKDSDWSKTRNVFTQVSAIFYF